jgi:tetratricopeptide (TPR) repeat protein
MRAEIAWAPTEYQNDRPGWQQRVVAVADAAIDYFSSTGDDANLAYALLQKAAAMSRHMAGMIETLQLAQVHAERAGDERALIQVWDELGGAMLAGPTPYDEVLDFCRREVEWARERGIAFTEADGRLGQAYALLAANDFEAARAELESVREMFARLPGFVPQLGECDTLGGFIELEAGDSTAAESIYRRAIETFDRGGNRRWRRTAEVGLVHALIDQQRADEAASLLADLEAQPFTPSIRADSAQLQARARLLAARGDSDEAVEIARQSVGMITGGDSPHFEGRARELLADLLGQTGDIDAARAEYEAAESLFAAKGYKPGEARVKAKLTPPQKAPAPGT